MRISLIAVFSSAFIASVTLASTCPPDRISRDELEQLRSNGFAVADDAHRQSVALALVGCLGSRDPTLRDGIAFTALSQWMQASEITKGTAREITVELLPTLAPDFPDPDGVLRPFAALTLAEVARMDRLDPLLDEASRTALMEAAIEYLISIDDYRAFDETVGWRHGVAHGADLLLQLSLNAALSKAQLDRILQAIAHQISPAHGPAYTHGESGRLARAVFFLAQRKLHSQDEWRAWFEQISAPPAPLSAWAQAYQSEQGLSRRHNTVAFLQNLYLYVREDGAEIQDRVLEPLIEAIKGRR